MNTVVKKVLSESVIQIHDSWNFHGLKGDRVRITGLRPADKDKKERATEELRRLLMNCTISIAEKWYVKGNVLVAIVLLEEKNIFEYLPHRKAFLIEPSRKHHPADHIPLVYVSGGLPRMWDNPLIKLKEDSMPFFKEIVYPTKFWLPTYLAAKKIVDHLYVDYTNLTPRNVQKIKIFHRSPGPAILVISGECGTGKTWFAIRNFIDKRPEGSDFAYIDLRGRPSGVDLEQAINRELGMFLDKNINEKLDVLEAIQHYLIPIVKPLFTREKFDPKASFVVDEMKRAYKEIAFSTEKLADYNDIRLGYYDNFGKTIYIIVDNIDTYHEDEQLVVFNRVIRRLHTHPGVKIITPLRPTSKLMMERLRQGLEFMPVFLEMRSPDAHKLLAKRLSISLSGKLIDLNNRIPKSGVTWNSLLESFIPSPGASLLRDLASVDSDIPPQDFYNRDAVQKARYDCRHYLRLFRRLLTSDVLLNVENICNEYFALHALLLRPGESFSPESSFLYNLFDNEDPELAGNALVRYRVLEYFHNNSEFGPIFDAYFRALGPGSRVARDIASSFVRAGLLTPKVLIDNEREIWTGINVTNAGRRHFALVRNLWYGICVKTGMLVEPDMIRRGDDARLLASKFVSSNKVLDFYAEHGWVSEEEFIGYLYRQEALEALRIGEFQASNKEFRQVITSLLEYKTSPADILSYDYSWQLYYWEKKRGTQ